MSSTRRVHVEITGNASGIRATLNQLDRGIKNSRSLIQGGARDTQLWSNQMKAFGTTARYALAGGLVFGVTSALGALAQFEQKMGDIASLTTEIGQGGKISHAGRDMEKLADIAIRQSTRLGVAVDQVQNAMQTYYSSFNNPKASEAAGFSNTLTKLAAVAETTDQQKLAEGLIGVSNSLGGGRRGIGREADIIAKVVARSVGFRGDVLAQNLGRLGSSAAAGGITDTQMAAIVTAASQVGGSPAVIARGVTQLQNNILNPRQKAQKEAYMQAGLPTDPNSLSQFKYRGAQGGYAVLLKMMDAVNSRGGLRTNKTGLTMSDEEAAALGDNASLAQLGISGGGGTNLAYGLFGRQESLRQFVALMAGGVPALEDFNREMSNAAGQVNAMFTVRNGYNNLARAQNSIRNIGMMTVRAADPALQVPAAGINRLGNFMADHTGVTQAVVGTAATVGATRLLSKMLPGVGMKLSGAGKIGRFLSGISSTERMAMAAALSAEAIPSVVGGGGGSDMGQRSNPMWVIIHPISWSVGQPGGMGAPGDGMTPVAAGGKFTKRAVGITAGVVATGAAAFALNEYIGGKNDKRAAKLYEKYPWLRNVLNKRASGAKMQYFEQQAVTLANLGKIDEAHDVLATREGDFRKAGKMADIMGGRRGARGQTIVQVQGDAKVSSKLELSDDAKRLLKPPPEQKISTKLWTAGAPQHRGSTRDAKSGTSR